MRKLLRSWLGPRTSQSQPVRALSRRRPEVETLEDRVVPSITLPTAGHPGPVTFTETNAPDQLMIRMQQGSTTNIQFSEDGGKTFQTAALADVTQVIVNGAGQDTLTLDMSNGLIGNTSTGGLPIQFNGGPGQDVLNLVGSPTGTVTETFTLGMNSPTDTLADSNGTSSTTISLASSTAIVDALKATNFIFNGNTNNNLITIQSLGQGANGGLVIAGFNAPALSAPGGPDSDEHGNHGGKHGDDNGKGDDKSQASSLNFLEDQDATTDNAFAALTLTNKTNVTVNGVGGNNLFVVNLPSVPAGLKSLTINGGTGYNVLVGSTLPTGLTITQVNIQREDTDANAIFIDLLYAERLDRAADQAGLNYWMSILNGAGGRTGVINGIEESLEGRSNLLRNWYRHFLGRDLDQPGANYWLGQFGQGESEEQIQAGILGSQEFMERAQSLGGGTSQNQNVVQSLYNLLLNRTADNNGLSYWQNFLQNNGAAATALSMMQSQEFLTEAVTDFYQSLLGRNLDDAGKNFWTSPAMRGQDLSHIRADIEGSDEFFHRGKHS